MNELLSLKNLINSKIIYFYVELNVLALNLQFSIKVVIAFPILSIAASHLKLHNASKHKGIIGSSSIYLPIPAKL